MVAPHVRGPRCSARAVVAERSPWWGPVGTPRLPPRAVWGRGGAPHHHSGSRPGAGEGGGGGGAGRQINRPRTCAIKCCMRVRAGSVWGGVGAPATGRRAVLAEAALVGLQLGWQPPPAAAGRWMCGWKAALQMWAGGKISFLVAPPVPMSLLGDAAWDRSCPFTLMAFHEKFFLHGCAFDGY